MTKINDSYYKVIIKNKEKVREYFLNANTRVTCDLYNALNRGKNQNILSYSLYGNDSFYFKYLHNLTYLVKKMYPKWSIRIYHDSSRELETIKCEIECKLNENSNDLIDNIDFCDATQLPVSLSNINLTWSSSFIHKMMWRWLPLGDDLVDIFSSRDSDSYIFEREQDSVNAWLNNTTKIAHIMRDNPAHKFFILGGLWGFKNYLDRNLSNIIFRKILNIIDAPKYNYNSKNGYDQNFLADYVYPLVQNKSVIHDSYNCKTFKDSEPYPSKRYQNFYLGSRDFSDRVSQKCPIECRPLKHQDWEFC